MLDILPAPVDILIVLELDKADFRQAEPAVLDSDIVICPVTGIGVAVTVLGLERRKPDSIGLPLEKILECSIQVERIAIAV